MEQVFYQREWQGIRLAELPPEHADVAGPRSYAAFYDRLLAHEPAIPANRLAHKRRIGEWLRDEVLRGQRPETARVLSIGAGLGLVERPLWEHGYQVDVLECEERSLRYVRARQPDARAMLGDARAIPCADATYDVVYMVTVDYCFSRSDYRRALAEMGRILRPGGRAVCVCMSNLAWPAMMTRALRTLLGRAKTDARGQVAWGYLRTVGDHIRAAEAAGLRSRQVYLFDPAHRLRAVREPSAWNFRWPTWHDAVVGVVFERASE